jgi:hypothetical protein
MNVQIVDLRMRGIMKKEQNTLVTNNFSDINYTFYIFLGIIIFGAIIMYLIFER